MTGGDVTLTGVRPIHVFVLVVVAVLVSVASCTKHDSLVLLELRSSGPLGAPVVRIRLSASGWPTRTVPGSIGPEGVRVGYYGPGDGKALTVKAEALDAVDCVLGIGSAGVPALEAGATSAPTTVFVRPQPGNGCAFDAGTGGIDAGESDTDGTDADESDMDVDAGSDVTADAGDDASPDAGLDASPDAGLDASPDGGLDTGSDDDAGSDAADD
jgi:hypothetical protein